MTARYCPSVLLDSPTKYSQMVGPKNEGSYETVVLRPHLGIWVLYIFSSTPDSMNR